MFRKTKKQLQLKARKFNINKKSKEDVMKKQTGIINISTKMFISAIIILALLIVSSSVLTYILPKGHFDTNYDNLVLTESQEGIGIKNTLLSPVLVLLSPDGISIIMLSIFLITVSGAFQVMADTNGMHSFIYVLINKFAERQAILVSTVTLIFMLFGSLFGLFEETLALLPIIIYLSLSIGLDSYTAFLICTVATGVGFASAITNPFTVVYTSSLIGANITDNIWYRVIIFLCMYAVLLVYIFMHIRKIKKDPEKSPTYKHDQEKKAEMENVKDAYIKKAYITYVIFLTLILFSILIMTSIEMLRDYTVVLLILLFLLGGTICGFIVTGNKKTVIQSFAKGCKCALPAILLVVLASCVKYILTAGNVIDTLANYIKTYLEGKTPVYTIFGLFLIMLILEFFISSSTAKAVFVMGILKGMVSGGIIGISANMTVLTYIFSDGYTNILFPTSPVLLIALSMIGLSYTKWVKKSILFFAVIFALAIAFLLFGLVIGY